MQIRSVKLSSTTQQVQSQLEITETLSRKKGKGKEEGKIEGRKGEYHRGGEEKWRE